MKKAKLYAPEKFGAQPCCYHDATPEQIAAAIGKGGCGPGGIGDYLVPDTMWGLNVRPACSIHDWQYHWGRTIDDKIKADLNLRDNLVRLIKAQNSWGFIENLRLRRARSYYEAVKYFGGPAFWSGKSSIYELREVTAMHLVQRKNDGV
jgi:hypothetical protein